MAKNSVVVLLSVALLGRLVLLVAADIVDDLQVLTENHDDGKVEVPQPSAARCYYKKQAFAVGAKFADETCTQLCTCLAGGHLRCTSLCESSRTSSPGCAYDQHLTMETVPSDDPSGRCKCHKLACTQRPQVSIAFKRCIVDGKEYRPGAQFADSKCAGWCRCLPTGNVVCEHLCHLEPPPFCGRVSEVQRKMVASRDRIGKCKCATLVCAARSLHAEVCNMDGQTYQVGQKFANKDCTMYCTCRPGGNLGCTSMCPPTAEPMCSFDSHVLIKEFSGADPSGRCKCRRTVCEKRKPVESGCLLEGQHYKSNEEFIDRRCAGRCRCLPHGGVMCFHLCDPYGVTCSVAEQLTGRRAMDKEGRCFCKCSQESKVGA